MVLLCQRFITTSFQAKIDNTGSCFYILSRQGVIEHLLQPLIIIEAEAMPGISQETLSIFIQILVNGSCIKIEESSIDHQHFETLVVAGLLSNGIASIPSTTLSKESKPIITTPVQKKPLPRISDEYSMIFSQLSQSASNPNTSIIPPGPVVTKRIKPTLASILYVNFNFFKFRLQTRWLIDFFSAKVHPSAGCLMKIILEKIEENNLCTASTRITLFNIIQRLPSDAPSFSLSPVNNLGFSDSYTGNIVTNVTAYLQLMMEASMGVLFRHKDETELSIGVSFDAIKSLSQSLLCEQYISDRFGDSSLRIYRLLKLKQLLEEKQISKLAMISLKDVRERLFQLHKNGLVSIQVNFF